MSRLSGNTIGWTDFECTPWQPPVYNDMNGEGTACDDGLPLNRYLNFPRRFTKYDPLAPIIPEFHDLQNDLELVYKPVNLRPDPVGGDYINTARIAMNNGITTIFIHACYPYNLCDPALYTPGYIIPPVPFISMKSPEAVGGDPGLSGLDAITDIQYQNTGLVYTKTTWGRPSGGAQASPSDSLTVNVPFDTIECP